MVKRVLVIPIAVALTFAVMGLRLLDLHVFQAKALFQVAEHNRFFYKPLLPVRGVILDRFDQPLVFNKPMYLLPPEVGQIDAKPQLLERTQALQMMSEDQNKIIAGSYRWYPQPEAFAHLLGYVGRVTREDLELNDALSLDLPLGKSGLEASLNSVLSGTPGEAMYEVNSLGQAVREIKATPQIDGKNQQTTIDAQLTQKAYELMAGRKGAVLVGDPSTGRLLAIVSSPSYDPNVFISDNQEASNQANRKQLMTSYFQREDRPLFNRTVNGAYPPGSVFKLVTAIAGLESKVLDKDTSVIDEGVLKVGDFQYGNWYFRQYGRVEGKISLQRAIARSNDIFFYKAAEAVGPDNLAKTAKMFGFGEKTGIELPGEISGLVPSPQWKEQRLGEQWFLGNTYHFGIGQGDLLVTPAQIFEAVTVLANRGKRCSPRILVNAQDHCQNLPFAEDDLNLVRDGMVDACSAGGTAFPFFPWNTEHDQKVACKTGTAEFGAADSAGHRKTHGWFVMFTDIQPRDEKYPKQIEMVVLVESDDINTFEEGSTNASPIALGLLKWIAENR